MGSILLIEPDKILGSVVVQALQAKGHKVVWRRTAQSALDSLDNNVPDLIILELQLRSHNGIEFLYEMRSYTEWQHIPIIIHTINANALDEQFSAVLEQMGVRAVLYKPRTSSKQLAQIVGRLQPV